MRNIIIQVCQINQDISNGLVLKHSLSTIFDQCHNDHVIDDSDNRKNYYPKNLIEIVNQKFIKSLKDKVNLIECLMCHRMLNGKYLKKLPTNLTNDQRQVIIQLVPTNTELTQLKICSEFCFKD